MVDYILACPLIILLIVFDLAVIVLLPSRIHLLAIRNFQAHAEIIHADNDVRKVEVEAEDKPCPSEAVE